jgi:MFS family permease
MRRMLIRLIVAGVFFAVAAAALAVAIGFVVAALYLAWGARFTPPEAALLTAACVFVVTIIAALVGWLSARRARPRRIGRDAAERKLAAGLGMLLGEEVVTLARSHARGTLVASLVAGFAVGASPRLRRALRALLDL